MSLTYTCIFGDTWGPFWIVLFKIMAMQINFPEEKWLSKEEINNESVNLGEILQESFKYWCPKKLQNQNIAG